MRLKLALIFVLFLGWCMPVKSQKDVELADMAQAKMARKEYSYALVLIEKAIALNDSNEWYYLTKADIETKLYGPKEALKSAQKAIRLNRKNAEAYSRAGTLYSSFNASDSAIFMYNLAIKYAEDDTTRNAYLVNRAAAKAMSRDFEGALADYKKTLEFDPDNIATLNNVAAVYSRLEQPYQGISYLKRIIMLDPSFVGTYVNLGFIYSSMDSLTLALNYFNKALGIEPDNGVTYNNRGYVFYKQGNYKAALTDINHAISLYPENSYAYRNLALVYLATSKTTEACEALHYAESYGFRHNYGDEVDTLIKKHCKH